ncbi:MAG: S8 family peptidase [Bdellovibrio sp.]
MRKLLLFTLLTALNTPLFAQPQEVALDPHNLRLKTLISLNHNDLPVTGKGVLVSVIDSGVSFSVPALRKNLIPGWNFITDDATMVDYSGHGTPVAGIVTIVAPDVTILPLVTMKDGGLREDVIDATIYAIQRNASVINLSVTFDEDMLRDVRKAVGSRKFKKSLLVISSGNTGDRRTDLKSTWDNVIVVGTIGLNMPVHSTHYSVYGPAVDIAAPSGDVGDGIATYDAFSSGVHIFNGTSGAAPVVSGAAALLKEKYPQARGADLKRMILAKACHSKDINVFNGRLLNVGMLFGVAAKCP